MFNEGATNLYVIVTGEAQEWVSIQSHWKYLEELPAQEGRCETGNRLTRAQE
jgi:hypothetical protein